MIIQFKIFGEPFGKQNMKPIIRNGHPVSCQTKKNYSYMQEVKYAFENSCSGLRFGDNEPIKVTITAYKSIPQYIAKSKKKMALLQEGKIIPTTKPDLDNISKVILDSLTGLAYRDDSQVALEIISKHYAEVPCTIVKLESMGEK